MPFVAGPGIKLEVTRQRHHVGPGLTHGLAAIALLQGRQLIGAFAHAPRQGHEQTAPVGGIQPGPGPLETRTRALHRQVNVARIAAGELGIGLTGGGINDGQGLSTD